jgi:hypothetical protein
LAFLVLDAIGPRGNLAHSLYRQPFALLGSWDGVWYQRIAAHGYLLIPGAQSNPAFFPVFPIILRVLHRAFGLPYTAAGAIVSNVFLLVAVVAFYELGRKVLHDEVVARRAACFMAVTPMGFVFSMSYPESFALALTAITLLVALDDRWLLAAALAATAVLARPEAIVLVVPLAAIAWSHRAALDPAGRGRALAAVLAAPAAVLSYPLYLKWSINDAHAWGQAQTAWGRAFDLAGPVTAFEHLGRKIHYQPVIARDIIFLLIYAGLLVFAARRGMSWPWIAGGALVLALPLFSGSVVSEGRFGLLALPVYWAVALLMRGRRSELAIQLGSLAVLVGLVMILPTFWP